jgi:ABC-type Fe3+/spermidine/putrescine transport system ATPase subunit
MPSITLKNISKYVCQNVNLEILDKEFLVFLGSNGAGKTTLINIIAGLTDYKGSVLFDGIPVDKLPANKREVGYLFQSLVLFPHLNVTDNIAYGLSARKWPQDRIKERVDELLRLVNIKHLAARYPKQLSGGERQRVALARAISSSPRVLLLDEPLSSLDARTAKYLRTELKQLQRRLGITTVYVTHDLMEAVEMADRMAIIQDGCVEQVAEPERVLFYPAGEKVADLIGAPNILDCDYCHSLEQGVMEVGCGGLKLVVPHEGSSVQKVAILPRHIYVSETKPPGLGVNCFQGTVTGIEFANNAVRIGIKAGQNNLMSEIPRYIFEEMDLAVGKEVFLILRMRRIRVYENSNLGHYRENIH